MASSCIDAESITTKKLTSIPFKQPRLSTPVFIASEPRILLGIMSVHRSYRERKLRHLIRDTYLKYYREMNTSTPFRICALSDLMKKDDNTQQMSMAEMEDCRIAYTFVVGVKQRSEQDDMENHTTIITNDTLIIEPWKVKNEYAKEIDVLYLNLSHHEPRMPQDPRKARFWFYYATTTRRVQSSFPWDIIVKIDSRSIIYPEQFWKSCQEIFQNLQGQANNSQKAIYGGMPVIEQQNCNIGNNCTYMYPMVVLSRSLAQEAFSSFEEIEEIPTESDIDEDKIIGSVLRSLSTDMTMINLNHTLYHFIPRNEKDEKLYAENLLSAWDAYKDAMLTYEDLEEERIVREGRKTSVIPTYKIDEHSKPQARFLVGIFTTSTDEIEEQRRQLIRSTYLSFYNATKNQGTPHRICSLYEIKKGVVQEQECQLAYAFVVGGNPEGTTELLQSNSSCPMTVDPLPSGVEPDMVYLNIRENMNQGKSQTWFKYALTILDDHYFDYIIKMDSDTIFFPTEFFEFAQKRLAPFPNNMRTYGGTPIIKPTGDKDGILVGPAYMTGFFYFLSPDLARFVTSKTFNRSAVDVNIEDLSMGNFVHSHPLALKRIRISLRFYRHPVKILYQFENKWKAYLAKKKLKVRKR